MYILYYPAETIRSKERTIKNASWTGALSPGQLMDHLQRPLKSQSPLPPPDKISLLEPLHPFPVFTPQYNRSCWCCSPFLMEWVFSLTNSFQGRGCNQTGTSTCVPQQLETLCRAGKRETLRGGTDFMQSLLLRLGGPGVLHGPVCSRNICFANGSFHLQACGLHVFASSGVCMGPADQTHLKFFLKKTGNCH